MALVRDSAANGKLESMSPKVGVEIQNPPFTTAGATISRCLRDIALTTRLPASARDPALMTRDMNPREPHYLGNAHGLSRGQLHGYYSWQQLGKPRCHVTLLLYMVCAQALVC